MNPNEVMVHVVQRQRRNVVLNLLAEGVRQSSEVAHLHSHGKVLPLYVRGADVVRVWVTRVTHADDFFLAVATAGLYRSVITYESPGMAQILT